MALTPRKLHAYMRRKIVVIKSIIPVRIGHKHFAMSVKQIEVHKASLAVPLLWANRIAMLPGLVRAVPLMLTIFRTRSGYSHPAAKLCMPPIELPTLAYSLGTPRWSSK